MIHLRRLPLPQVPDHILRAPIGLRYWACWLALLEAHVTVWEAWGSVLLGCRCNSRHGATF